MRPVEQTSLATLIIPAQPLCSSHLSYGLASARQPPTEIDVPQNEKLSAPPRPPIFIHNFDISKMNADGGAAKSKQVYIAAVAV